MLKVGLTGGIGSGKTTIAQTFATIGVKIYDCDQAAHRLTDSDPIIINGLKSMFGTDIYQDGLLNRKALASIIFNDKDALSKVNALIHPRVTYDFNHWCDNRKSEGAKYVICETAILFECGMDKLMDKTILANLPTEMRIERAMARDSANREQIAARIRNQSNSNFEQKADFVIVPDDKHFILPQILEINNLLNRQ